MRNRFDRELVRLNNELIEMGSMIEKSIETAVKAMVNQDVELANRVIESDDEIDQQERQIEDLCLKLLLQQQPVAKDLRLISSALKMVTDMERIGDHATDISEITIALADKSYIKKLEHLKHYGRLLRRAACHGLWQQEQDSFRFCDGLVHQHSRLHIPFPQ